MEEGDEEEEVAVVVGRKEVEVFMVEVWEHELELAEEVGSILVELESE